MAKILNEEEITCLTQGNYNSKPSGANVPIIRPVPKLKYRWRSFRKAGVVVILYWSFVIFVVFRHIFNVISHHPKNREVILFGAIAFPLAGLLTEFYVNKSKLIRFGIFLMWISSLFLPVVYMPSISDIKYVSGLRIFLYCTLSLGLFCCLINIIQFGIEQCEDSSSLEITSFIRWFAWTYFASEIVVELASVSICSRSTWISVFYLPCLLSIALCISFLFNNYLVVVQSTENPLKLIFGVMKYAAMNRYPRLRSSYIHWNNRCCSRIDLAKSIFGGPFSTQQVQDVKSFFQIGLLMLLTGIFLTVINASDWLIIRKCCDTSICVNNIGMDTGYLIKSLFLRGGYILITICVPVCECVILPVTRSCWPYLNLFSRLAISGICCLMYIALLLIFSMTNTLDLGKEEMLHWFLGLSVLRCLGVYIIIATGIEFVCAQSPRYMTGIFISLFYLNYVASFGSIIKLDNYLHFHGHKYVGELLFNMLLGIVVAVVYIILVCFYKARQWYDKSYDNFEEFNSAQ